MWSVAMLSESTNFANINVFMFGCSGKCGLTYTYDKDQAKA